MNVTVVLLVVVALACIAFALRATKLLPRKRPPPWNASPRPIMTSPEQILFQRLTSALPGHMVFSQVTLGRVVRLADPASDDQRRMLRSKTIDYVICNLDGSIFAAIELSDGVDGDHYGPWVDQNKEAALRAANIRLVRWSAARLPDLEDIQRTLAAEPDRLARPTSPKP